MAAYGREILRFVRFTIVGVLATLVHAAVSLGLVGLTQLSTQIANTIGFVTAMLFSYLGHYFFSFESNKAHRGSVPRFLVVAIAAFAANLLLVEYLGTNTEFSDALRLMLGIGIMPIMTFTLHRFWVY